MPIVEMKVVLKASSENLDKEKLFNPGLVSMSYFVNFVSTGSWLKYKILVGTLVPVLLRYFIDTGTVINERNPVSLTILPEEDTGLAHSRVSNEQQLEEKVVRLLRHSAAAAVYQDQIGNIIPK